MSSPKPPLEPRSRIVALSAAEVVATLRRANAADDPYDPRQGLVLAAQAFLDWLVAEHDDRLAEGLPATLASDAEASGEEPVWQQRPACDQRASPVIDVAYNGHRVDLLTVARREGSSAPVEYSWPVTWAAQGAGTAVCCVYVEAEASGEVAVVLDGWVRAEALAQQLDAAAARGEDGVVVGEGSLLPMGALWEVLCERRLDDEARPADAGATPSVRRWRLPLRWVAVAAVAAVVVLAALRGLFPGRGRLSTSVVAWEFESERVRGATGMAAVAYSGQKYALRVEVATSRKHGWLFQIDAAGAYLLTSLQRLGTDLLGATYSDRFDDRPGPEYFVVVLANGKPAELGVAAGAVAWLSASDLSALQVRAREQDDQGAVALIREALQRAAPQDKGYDVRVLRVSHLEPQEPDPKR